MADAKRTLRECLDERLKEGRARGLERRPPLLDMAGEGPVVHMGGRAFLNFTLNDGLGLASSAEWRAEVGECFAAFPPSASASRLAGGRSRITEEAEQAVAAYFGFDECLFLSSGYQGNLACYGVDPCGAARLCGSPGTCQHRPRARIGESRCADVCPCGLWTSGTAACFRPSRRGTAAGDDGVLVQYGRYGT